MERGVDSTRTSLTKLPEFVDGLHTVRHRDRPLAPVTIVRYRSAIATIHQGFPDGSTVS